MPRPQSTGTSSITEQTPARRRRRAAARRREEQRWAALAGPVTVTTIEETTR